MRTVWRILAAQVAVTIVAAVVARLIGGEARSAWSALIGGAIGFSAAAFYARNIFAARGKEPRELVKAHFRAEALKLAFTVVLLATALTIYKDVSTLPLLLTYIATLSVYWFALLWV